MYCSAAGRVHCSRHSRHHLTTWPPYPTSLMVPHSAEVVDAQNCLAEVIHLNRAAEAGALSFYFVQRAERLPWQADHVQRANGAVPACASGLRNGQGDRVCLPIYVMPTSTPWTSSSISENRLSYSSRGPSCGLSFDSNKVIANALLRSSLLRIAGSENLLCGSMANRRPSPLRAYPIHSAAGDIAKLSKQWDEPLHFSTPLKGSNDITLLTLLGSATFSRAGDRLAIPGTGIPG